MIEDAVKNVFLGSRSEVFLPCIDRANQESLRAQAFIMRNKIAGKQRDEIGIQKFKEDEHLYVRIYKREKLEFYERDPETGRLIPAQVSAADISADTRRLIELMRKDGKSEEEIKAYLQEPCFVLK